ncbi:helix-turn-helix domain-containing protein [Kitasatospora sp. A2-31]|uniref:helix-turn-helix domain-containing protein n=1 Tax=Kitasatospora sp. A2-31 TaxID=2916414 RepID=UPI001EEB88EC|nr:helix-turn-helix transcriptional regulator [Kitasatospora sp. A2-31]MCG6497031.1 helix-turn-helix domain-containing protein [Kitasatospora sp. A2-31]
MTEAAREGVARIAATFNYLLDNRHPQERGPYSIPEVATGTGISESTLKQMKAGANDNPKINTLVAVAKFFDVPPDIWVTDKPLNEVLIDRDLHNAMRDAGIESIALRSKDLNPENRRLVADMITVARKSQGLDPEESGAS